MKIQTSPTLRKEHLVKDGNQAKFDAIRAAGRLRTRILVQEHTGSPLSQNLGDIFKKAGL